MRRNAGESSCCTIEHRDQTLRGERTNALATGIAVLLTLTVFQRVVGFVRSILFCRYLEPEELGLWNLAFSALLMIAPLIVLGLPGSFGRYVEYYRQRGQLITYLRRTLALTMLVTFGGIALLAFWWRAFAWLIFGDTTHTELMLVLTASMVPVILFNLLVELCTALRRVRLMSYMQLANGVLFAVVALSLLFTYRMDAVSIVVGYAAACLITSLGVLGPLYSSLRSREGDLSPMSHGPFWRKLLPFAAWIWFYNLSANLFSASDRYMIIHFSTLDTRDATGLVGQFHSSRVVPELIIAIAAMLSSVILPYLSHDWEKGRYQQVGDRLNLTLKLFGLAATLSGCFVMMISPWLFGWALGGKYADGLAVLPWTLTYCSWFGLFLILQNYLLCREKASSVGISLLSGLLVNIVLNYVLLPRMGLPGAVLATAAGNFSALALSIIWCRSAGMKLDPATIVVCLLPLSLALGASWAIAIGLALLWIGLRSQFMFSRREIDLCATTFAMHVGRFYPRVFRGSNT